MCSGSPLRPDPGPQGERLSPVSPSLPGLHGGMMSAQAGLWPDTGRGKSRTKGPANMNIKPMAAFHSNHGNLADLGESRLVYQPKMLELLPRDMVNIREVLPFPQANATSSKQEGRGKSWQQEQWRGRYTPHQNSSGAVSNLIVIYIKRKKGQK